jgi:Gamma tubulin complex component N-terminal
MRRAYVCAPLSTAVHNACTAFRLRDLAGSGGNEGFRHLYLFLLHRACTPYLGMLSSWMYSGALEDPYNEFMIREEEGMLKGDVQVWQYMYEACCIMRCTI